MNKEQDSKIELLADKIAQCEQISYATLSEYFKLVEANCLSLPKSFILLGHMLAKQDRWTEISLAFDFAVQLLDRTEQLEVYDCWQLLATLFLDNPATEHQDNQNVLGVACTIVERCIELDPDNPGRYFVAAATYSFGQDLERFHRAIALLQKAETQARERNDQEILTTVDMFLPAWTKLAEDIEDSSADLNRERIKIRPAGLFANKRLIY